MKFGKRGQVSHLPNHVGQMFSRSVQELQSSGSPTLCKYTVVNNSRLLNSYYCINEFGEIEYLPPALQTLMIVVDSNRQKIAAASFILQRTWQQVITRKAVIAAGHRTAQTSVFLVVLFCPAQLIKLWMDSDGTFTTDSALV